jgi:hypothetical protein
MCDVRHHLLHIRRGDTLVLRKKNQKFIATKSSESLTSGDMKWLVCFSIATTCTREKTSVAVAHLGESAFNERSYANQKPRLAGFSDTEGARCTRVVRVF